MRKTRDCRARTICSPQSCWRQATTNNHVDGAETALREELVISPARFHDVCGARQRLRRLATNYREAEGYLKKATSFGPQKPRRLPDIWDRCISATNRSAEAEDSSSSMHPSHDRCVAESISDPEGAFSSGQDPDAERSSGMRRTQRWKSARDLANKTLAQDKSKLAGLAGYIGDHRTLEELRQKTGHLLP